MRILHVCVGTGALLLAVAGACAPEPGAGEVAPQARSPAAPVEVRPAPAVAGATGATATAVRPEAVAAAQEGPGAGDVAFVEAPPRPEITSAEVLAELKRIGAENTLPGTTGWVSDAGATVAGDPKLASQIAGLLREPTSTYLMRSVGISLLRTDGSEHAQAGLREVLADPGFQADSMYSGLLLGVANLPRPAEETVALIQSLRSSAQVRVRESATSVLGTLIWTLSVSGRVPLANSLAAELVAALKASRDPAEQANLIEALAHGNRPQTWATVRGFARSKDPILRAATAKGLASDEGPEAVSLLIKLLVDPEQEVQSVALDSLHWRTLSAAQQRAVHAAILKGAVRPKSDLLLALFVERHFVAAARKEALEALLARHAEDEEVTEKIREVLARG